MTTSSYQRIDTEAEYRQAVDVVLSTAQKELRIFDADLGRIALDAPERVATLDAFLRQQGTLRIVVRDPSRLERAMPRFAALHRTQQQRLQIRRCPQHLQHLADCHVLADACHGVRRFHADRPRAAIIRDDPPGLQGWWQRFDEIWMVAHDDIRLDIPAL